MLGRTFSLLSNPPGISFARRNVPPPSNLYVSLDDSLYLEAHNLSAATFIDAIARVLLPDGSITTHTYRLTFSVGSVFSSPLFPLMEGFLLGVLVAAGGGTAPRGTLWVRAVIVRGGLPGLLGAQTLIQDYAETHYAPSWPGGTLRSSVDGAGVIRAITGTNPAAGNQITETVTTAARWRLESVFFQLTTSGVAGNRQVLVILEESPIAPVVISSPSLQAASLTYQYCAAAGITAQAVVGTRVSIPLPVDVWLDTNMRFRIQVVGMDAGDDLTAPDYLVEQLVELLT